jgi:hypothetical protein
MTRASLGLLILIVAFAAALPAAEKEEKAIVLFNGRDLTNFYTFLQGQGKNNDPDKVFTVTDGILRISGQHFGGLITEQEYSNYRLVTEFKWGEKTWPPREKATRDSGILLHCVGEDGGSSYKDGKPVGPWMESIECQMIEGGTGDIILVGGKGKPRLTVEAEKRPTGAGEKKSDQPYFKPGAPAMEFTGGRINWFGRDPEWKDVKGFRGKQDVEKPVGQWNTLECLCDGDSLTYTLNGVVVNKATKSSHTRGKILIQSEGAEVFFRKIELHPLRK